MSHKRVVPSQTVKLGLDTVAMLREVAGDYATLDQAVWRLAEGLRQFVALRVQDRPRSTDGTGTPVPRGTGTPVEPCDRDGIPDSIREKYHVPRHADAYFQAAKKAARKARA